jgi:hypothetical protein
MLKAKPIKRGISELSPIITVNSFQAVGMLIIQPQSQEPKVLKYLILALQKEKLRVTRVIINNNMGKHFSFFSNSWIQLGPTPIQTQSL